MLKPIALAKVLSYALCREALSGKWARLVLRPNVTHRPGTFEGLFLIFPCLKIFYRYED